MDTPTNPSPDPLPPPASPPPSNISPEERQMAMFCHLISFAGYFIPLGNIIGPLVLWQMKKETMPFVNDQGKESLNFQISVTIYAIITLVFLCIGLPVILLVAIFSIIVVIMASIDSNNGKAYRYPLCIRLIK